MTEIEKKTKGDTDSCCDDGMFTDVSAETMDSLIS